MNKQEYIDILNEALGKLYVKLDNRIAMIEDAMASKKQVSQLITSIDGLAKRVADDDVERSAMTAQLDRHENWIKQTSSKLGVELRYDQ
jgi:hypothetical protein